jgi:hypothetical protein
MSQLTLEYVQQYCKGLIDAMPNSPDKDVAMMINNMHNQLIATIVQAMFDDGMRNATVVYDSGRTEIPFLDIIGSQYFN